MSTYIKKKLLPVKVYYQRLLKSFVIASIIMIFSLVLGILGYHYICHLKWLDPLSNALRLIGDMCPVDIVIDETKKVFASFYALFSGISFLTSFAILMTNSLQRLLYKFHIDRNE